MSALDMEKERAEFEAFAPSIGLGITRAPKALMFANGRWVPVGGYILLETAAAWASWQACATGYAARADVLETKILGLSSNQDGLRARLLSALDRFERAVALLDRHGLSLCDECDDAGCVCCRGDR